MYRLNCGFIGLSLTMNYKRILTWIFLFSCLFTSCLSAQETIFSAKPSANKVGVEDPFQVDFTIRSGASVSNFTPPDFTGFRVLGGPIQSSRSSVSIINGRQTRSSAITLTYVLQALRPGKFSISPASISINGIQYRSNPVELEVVKGHLAAAPRAQGNDPFSDPFFDGDDDPIEAMRRQQQQMQQLLRQRAQRMQQQYSDQHTQMADLDEKNLHKNIFIKVTVDKTHPHVGEQLTASYKLYTRLPMNMSLTQLPSLNGFWSEDFEIPNPPKPHEEIVDGKAYQVFLLKKSALFPQQAGPLTLDPAKAEGVVRVIRKVRGQNPFGNDPLAGSLFMDDPLFNDDFFSGYDYKDVKTNLSSQPVTIRVEPLPEQNRPAGFTGAVGHFTIHTELDTSVLSTDGGGNFRVVIAGSGNLKLIGEPQIDFPAGLGAMDAQVADTILSRNPTINGRKIFSYNLSPQQPGAYMVPVITFSYFDPVSSRYQTLTTRPVTVKVVQGSTYVAVKKDVPADIHNIKQGPLSGKSGHPLFLTTAGYWSLYGVSLLVFGLFWFSEKRKRVISSDTGAWKKKTANKVAWKRLSEARKLLSRQDTVFYEEVSKAIWLYLSDKLNIPISALSRENITEKLADRQVPAKHIGEVHQLISECEMALYSRSGGRQQREHTLTAASDLIATLESILQVKKSRHFPGVKPVASAFLLLIAALSGFVAWGADAAVAWQRANTFYLQGQYDSALVYYRQVNASGIKDGALFYNMGNCYYRLGETAPAVLYFEKALHADPGDRLTADNLALALARVQTPVAPAKPIFFISWWENWVLLLSPQFWSWLMLLLFLAGLGMIYMLGGKKRQIRFAGRWMSIILVAFLLSATMTFFSYSARNSSDKAVVMVPDTPFFSRLSAATGGQAAEATGRLPEGAVLHIREKRKAYCSVTLPNGSQGWVSGEALALVAGS